MYTKGFERERSCPVEVFFRNLPRGTEENSENFSQDNKFSEQDSKGRPPE